MGDITYALGAGSGLGTAHPLLDALSNVPQTRQDAHEGEAAGVDNLLLVDKDLEGAIRSGFEVHVDSQVTTEHRRRPGGMQRCDSISAATDDGAHNSSGTKASIHVAKRGPARRTLQRNYCSRLPRAQAKPGHTHDSVSSLQLRLMCSLGSSTRHRRDLCVL